MDRECVVDGIVAEKIAVDLCRVGNLEFDISGHHINCRKGIAVSINNQQGNLRDINYFGRNFEYTVQVGNRDYPIAFQLYENTSHFYRIFLFCQGNKMLTSVNLTKGLDGDKI